MCTCVTHLSTKQMSVSVIDALNIYYDFET